MKNSKSITLGLAIAAFVMVGVFSATSLADKITHCQVCGYSFGAGKYSTHPDCERIKDKYPEWYEGIKKEQPPKLRKIEKKQRNVMKKRLMEESRESNTGVLAELGIDHGTPITSSTGKKADESSRKVDSTTVGSFLGQELKPTVSKIRQPQSTVRIPGLTKPALKVSPVLHPPRMKNNGGKSNPYQKFPTPNEDRPNGPPKLEDLLSTGPFNP